MSATTVTPLSAVPSAAGDVSGSFLAAGLNLRLSCALTAAGSDTLYLIRLNDANYWEQYVSPQGRPYQLAVSRGSDFAGASGSIEVPVRSADKYHVVSSTGFATAHGVVKLNSLQPPSGLATVPGHGAAHTSIGSDPLPLAVAGGASGLMSGTQCAQLLELSGGTAAQTISPSAPADGSSTALTVNNTVTLVSGNKLLDVANNGSIVFSLTYLGGAVCPTVGPTVARQHTLPSVASDTVALLAATQTLAGKTLTSPVVATGLTASGSASNDFSGSTGSFKTSTGAVTVGGGSAAVTITGGAASTWSTSSGALTVSGFAGTNLQVNGATLVDVGATSATAVTLAANTALVGAAGTGAVTLGSMTGATTLPTGNLSWAGASTKAASLVTSGAGSTITLSAGAASTWKTTAGALTVDGNGGLNLQAADATLLDVGVTSGTAVTLAANINLSGAAGTGALSLGSMTGATALPTGNLAWAGASTKTLSLVSTGSGSAVTITAGAASTWSTSAGALTVDAATTLNLGTTAAASVAVGKAGTTYGFNGVTPAAIPTPAGYSTLQTAGSVTILYSTSATTGGIGSTQHTLGDLVASLKTLGLIKV